MLLVFRTDIPHNIGFTTLEVAMFIYLFIYNNISLGKLSHQSDFQRGPKCSVYLLIFLMVFVSVELRELEAKLKAGYMNRERAAQLAEKRAMTLDQQVNLPPTIAT